MENIIPNWSQSIEIVKDGTNEFRMINVSSEPIDYMTAEESISTLWPNNYAFVSKADIIKTIENPCYNGHFKNGYLNNGEVVLV